jgi:hypothetical protein
MPPKIFTCLTWPAITARVTPASLSRLMQVPSWPIEIQWMAAPCRRAASFRPGKASSFVAMTVTS